jgi:hypothetical protein
MGRNEVVHALQAPVENIKEEAGLLHSTSARLQGLKYDRNGVLYWTYAALARKIAGKQMPLKNDWGRAELVYCVEVLQAMPEYLMRIGADLEAVCGDMVSPERAYQILAQCSRLVDVTEHVAGRAILEHSENSYGAAPTS